MGGKKRERVREGGKERESVRGGEGKGGWEPASRSHLSVTHPLSSTAPAGFGCELVCMRAWSRQGESMCLRGYQSRRTRCREAGKRGSNTEHTGARLQRNAF